MNKFPAKVLVLITSLALAMTSMTGASASSLQSWPDLQIDVDNQWGGEGTKTNSQPVFISIDSTQTALNPAVNSVTIELKGFTDPFGSASETKVQSGSNVVFTRGTLQFEVGVISNGTAVTLSLGSVQVYLDGTPSSLFISITHYFGRCFR